MRSNWSVVTSTFVLVIAIQVARAAETTNRSAEMQEVTVTGQATGSATSVPPEESAKQKTQVPGVFTVKTADDMELVARQTLKICCNEHRASSFKRKMAPRFPRFQFEGPESHLKTSHSA